MGDGGNDFKLQENPPKKEREREKAEAGCSTRPAIMATSKGDSGDFAVPQPSECRARKKANALSLFLGK